MPMKYRVQYVYLATGMEGKADERDFGPIEAVSADDACDQVALLMIPEDQPYAGDLTARGWVRRHLSASPWTEDS